MRSDPKIVVEVPSDGLETLPPVEVIRICANALNQISSILSTNILEKEGVLYNDKSAAKLIKKYIDDALYWVNKM